MSRSNFTIQHNLSFAEAQNKVLSVLQNNSFNEKTLKTGETVWKNGTGLMTAMKFIKVEYAQNSITIYAWVQTGIGDIGGGEMDLTGFVAALPKKQLLKVIEEIKTLF